MLNRRTGTYLMRLLPIKIYGRIVPREVIGFCYHVVSDRRLPHVEHLYPHKSVEQFEADLVYLQRTFRVVSHRELLEARESGQGVGPNAVHLSFDDGYEECFSVVRPLLLKHGIPCTFFVNPGVLDNVRMLDFNRVSLCVGALRRLAADEAAAVLRELEGEAGSPLADVAEFSTWIRRMIRDPDSGATGVLDRLCPRLGVDVEAYLRRERPYMTTEQVRRLAADGFTIGGHTRMHAHMGSTAGEARVEDEIVASCRAAAELSGTGQAPFAFPYDANGVDRGFMEDVLRRNPWIGPLFGTGKLKPDREFMVNRVVTDWPPALVAARTNLPGQLRGAYLDEMIRLAGESDRPLASVAWSA